MSFLIPTWSKVAVTAEGRALYFSRAPIPWTRDGASGGLSSQTRLEGALRHIGPVCLPRRGVDPARGAARRRALNRSKGSKQLRALENGMEIVVANLSKSPGRGVDTESDLEAVARLLAT